jgi:hypothetical protein
VRLAAVAKIQNDDLLAVIAKDAAAMDARLAAVSRISSQQHLADIIKTRRNYELMGACFARITDTKILTSIAEDPGYNPAARRMAVEQFADESYLADIAESAGQREGTERKSDAAVDGILATYGDIKVVRALARFRGSEKALMALGTIAAKGGEAGGLAVEYLCRALGNTNPTLRQCAARELASLRDPELVSVMVRSLDIPELHQPIREVLRQIDTTEAKAALGETEQ